jgi:DNA-binding response OmpR family regulator
MLESMISRLVRRPALLDSAGLPVLPTPLPILLIDPDTARAGQLAMLLERPTQHIAGDLVAVLAVLAVEKPQLVLLVHDPPALDAVALCQTLRAASNVPIILLMTTPGGYDRARALWAGADDALPFPLAPNELHARIAALPRRR